MPGLLRVDGIDFVADIDAVGDGLFMIVFADDILLEEAVGAVVRRGGQTDEIGVEILQNLTPEVVNRAVAFVDDDEIEELRRNLAVVDNRHGLPGLNEFRRIDLLGGVIHLLALQERVHALDGADANLAIPGDEGRGEALDVVKLGELVVVVAGHVGHEFLLGLFAQVPGVHEKKNALGVGVFEQPVDRGDGRVGLARAGGHLNQGTRAVLLEGCLQLLDGRDLAGPQCRRVQVRKPQESRTKRGLLDEPVPHRPWPGKAEYLPGAGLRIAAVGEAREHPGAFVNEWQRLLIVHPLKLGNGITGGLLLDRRDLLSPILRLGLDHADGLLADEKNIVGWAGIRLILANGDP